jgi:prepilin-type N-terminal cleavage/methylation domain-containing protein
MIPIKPMPVPFESAPRGLHVRLGCLKQRAFSLVEILVAVTLMSVIVLGLMTMFGHTQRAFRLGITQVDVLESGRAALELMAREIEQAGITGHSNTINFYVATNLFELEQELPGTTLRRINILQNLLFASPDNRLQRGIGYSVVFSNYIGTLYRYEAVRSALDFDAADVATVAWNAFYSSDAAIQRTVNPSRVADGIVHLRYHTYDSSGHLISPTNWPAARPDLFDISWGGRPDDISARFMSNALPAYVEIELGVLEPKSAERARNLPLASQQQFLEKQAGQVHVFRQRVPIRNLDPSVYQ